MRYSDENGFYELNPFPGCNQVVVSNHAHIYKVFRGKGRGKTQHMERLSKANILGYDYIICTVNNDNNVEKHILEKHHWKKLDGFVNTETGHLVEIWGRRL